MNIVGLGGAGCAIASMFLSYEQYEVFFVDTEKKDNYRNYYKIKNCKSHEEYEEKYKKINFKMNKDPLTIILSGSGAISGVILRLLQQLKDCDISVLYVKPDLSSSTQKERLRHKIVFGVLQQYVRSGLIKKIYVVDNHKIEEILGPVSIQDYWENINKIISSSYHMLNVFENTEPILSTFGDPGDTSKICALGVVGYKALDEKMFYDLKYPRMKKYFFGITEKTLSEEKSLLQKIRSFISERSTEEKCDTCFSIYTTDYSENYVYAAHYASFVQEEDFSLL